MPEFSDVHIKSSNGKSELRVRRCTPDGAPRAVIQLAHGIAEHVERYDAFAAFLASHGFVVVANDHLGHGKSTASEKELGFFSELRGWDLVVSDMHTLQRQTAGEFPGLPYFLFGHSMGSFLTRTYLCKYPGDLSGAVISGTGQQSAPLLTAGIVMGKLEMALHGGPAYHSKLLNDMAFGSYNNHFKPSRTPHDWLSRDNAVVDAYTADPLCGFIPSAGLLVDMLGGIRFIEDMENLRNMDKALPILFFSGEDDPVGDYGKGVKKAYNSFLAAGMQDVSIKLYPGCRHECLNELNRDQVFDDVLTWLETKMK